MSKLALVFSGGGAKGAFGAGVFSAVLQQFAKLQWHIVSGTSTGSLIAPFAALALNDTSFEQRLSRLYTTVSEGQIVDRRYLLPNPAWQVARAFFDGQAGVATLDPLARLIAVELPDSAMKTLESTNVATIITAVNLQSGRLSLCTQDHFWPSIEKWYSANNVLGGAPAVENVAYRDFRKMMVASSSMPIFSDPIDHNKEQFVDGGVFDKAPLRPAIAAGADDALVVLMEPLPPTTTTKKFANVLDIGLRSLDLLQEEGLRNDIDALRAAAAVHLMGTTFKPSAKPELAALGSVTPYLRAHTHVYPVVVYPEHPLGETMDFDSKVSPGWPEKPTATGPKVSIMQARYDYGVRRVKELLKPKSELQDLLEKYSPP